MRAGLDTLGIDSKDYAGHRFRIGTATTAAERGVEDSLLKMLGQWEGSASRELLAGISKHLSHCPPK